MNGIIPLNPIIASSGVVSGGKLNILDELYRLKVKISSSFQKNHKKVTGKQKVLRKTSFQR